MTLASPLSAPSAAAPDAPPPSPAALFEAGSQAHRQGDLATAAYFYQSVLTQQPDHADALDLMGMLYLQTGDTATALALLEQAVRAGAGDPWYLRHLGAVQVAGGRLTDAAASFGRALDLAPDHGETLYNLGQVTRQLGDNDRALPLLEHAAAALPGFAGCHYELGMAYQTEGRSGRALRSYRRVLELEPEHAAAHSNIGLLLHHAGDLPRSAAAYRRALRCQTTLTAARNNLAAALMDENQMATALALIHQALQLDPGAADGWNGLGVALQRLDQPEAAITAYHRALRIDPLAGAIHANLAECLRDLGRGEQALASYHRLCHDRPHDHQAHLLVGNALERAGDLAGAAAAFATALALNGDDAETLQKLGLSLVELGNHGDGIGYLRRACALAADQPAVQRSLALALIRHGDGPGALAASDQALALDRHDQEAWTCRALALRLAGQPAAADWLTDPYRWVRVANLGLGENFNGALAEELRSIGNRKRNPTYQSLRGGTQTQNDLFALATPLISQLQAAIDQEIHAFMASLATTELNHPFPAGLPRRYTYRSWSVVLDGGGYHVPHIHPEGWMSGCYYVALPDEIGGADQQGCLEFGTPWAALAQPLPEPPPARVVPPAPGRLVLFPSYFWHGTRPFHSRGQRITVAFDVLPLER